MEQLRAMAWPAIAGMPATTDYLDSSGSERCAGASEPCGDAVYVRRASAGAAGFSTGILLIEVDVRPVGKGHGSATLRDRQGKEDAMSPGAGPRVLAHRAAGFDGHHAGGLEQHVRLGQFGARRLRGRSRARRHAAARASVDGRAVQRSRHGRRGATGSCGCAVSPGVSPIRIHRVRRSPIVYPCSMCRPMHGAAVTITFARRLDAAGVPQLTKYDGRSDRTAPGRSSRGASVRILRRCRTADLDWSVLPTGPGCPTPWLRIASTRIFRRYGGFVRSSECVRPARSWVFRSPISRFASTCRRET